MKLKSITLSGYKSINQEGATLSFGDVTVLLGANGVGKSNVVSFFSMLNYMLTGSLQNFIAERGFADSFLHFGSKNTRQVVAKIKFISDRAIDTYDFTLTQAAGDILIFTEEVLTNQFSNAHKPYSITLNPGVKESDLLEYVKSNNISKHSKQTALLIRNSLRDCRVSHFQDTSLSARIRGQCYIDDNKFLNAYASNLPAFLYRLKYSKTTTAYYEKIVRYIQKAMPQFGDFDLKPNAINPSYITLNWREKGNIDYLFGPHQISDGSLRFMALATLLLQPEGLLPKVIVLDEPELGLHPSAIGYLAGMIKAASQYCQVVIATQSQRLVDEFEIENIVVVERNKLTNNTEFKQKTATELSDWLDQYSLGELWEKNVIGGQP